MTADDYVPPPRSLLWAKAVSTEQGPGLELGCDCATVTVYIIEDADQITSPQEIPMTCDGCNSVRWVTVGPADQLEREARDA